MSRSPSSACRHLLPVRTGRSELWPPTALNSATLKIGETVKVTGNRAKNPESTNIGQATILNEGGKRVFNGQNAAAQP